MKIIRSHRWLSFLLGLFMLIWSFYPSAARLEFGLYSSLAALLPTSSVPPKTAVITINEPAASGGFTYQTLASLIDQLVAVKVAAIGITMPLRHAQTLLSAETRERILAGLDADQRGAVAAQLDPDTRLRESQSRSKRIVMAAPLAPGAVVSTQALKVDPPENQLAWMLPVLRPPRPAPELGQLTLPELGALDTFAPLSLAAARGVVAAAPLVFQQGERYLPAFELLLATRAFGVPADALTVHPGRGVAVGSAWYATDAGLQVLPRLMETAIPQFSAQDILNAAVPLTQLQGKAVLIGLANEGILSQPVLLPGGATASQLQWKAQVVNALQNMALVNNPFWSLGLQRGMLVLILLYLIFLPMRLRGYIGLATGLVGAIFLLNASLLLLVLQNTWLPLGLPVVLLLSGQLLVWGHHRIAQAYRHLGAERDRALVELAANLRNQGQLDAAFNRLRDCGKGEAVLSGLYELGLEYERRRQYAKAHAAYERITQLHKNYRDVRERLAREQTRQEAVSLAATSIALNPAATTLVVDDPQVERPVLGRYQIERELGRGAMGTVYLGRDPRIGRTVAIKTLALSEEFESTQLDEVRRRFFQEAETAGRLSHPNIVTIYDVGEEHDLAYIAMDYIQGDSLDLHAREDSLLPVEDVFHIGIQVAEALEYAHEQKVVHRDVKPGNIIYDRDKGQLKVTDFGIACLTDNSKTRTGTVLGSPYYMSPEQIAGKKVDGRSDLFSLGVTLYQLFSGRLPFEGDSLTNLMYQITNEKPKGVRKVRPELPTCVTRLLNKALEKQPARRYANGQEMADAIRRCGEQSGYL